jgi:MATE family multidrug resistance protein
MVDTAIVGHLNNGDGIDYIGAIAVGTMIFNIIYWNFGFLRMGTSGFTAQAYGSKDVQEQANILLRASFIAIAAAFLLIVFQKPIGKLSLMLIEDKNSVGALALSYFSIRIWAAPATLGMYALKGWFIGMQDSKNPMWISIIINILNIAFSFILVFYCNMSIKGVALGTVIAQYGGLITTIIIWKKKYGNITKYFNLKKALSLEKMKLFFKVNSDIFLRTLCLIIVTSYFTIASTKMPYPTLAMNTLLMQFFTLFSYFMDGFAYAAESLCGKAKGENNYNLLKNYVKRFLLWGSAISILFIIIYAIFGENILMIFTDNKDVLEYSKKFLYWILLIPITGFIAFLYDGILIGLTESVIMRNAIFISTLLFFLIYFTLTPLIGNNALWLAFLIYLSGRSLLMMWMSKSKIFIKN